MSTIHHSYEQDGSYLRDAEGNLFELEERSSTAPLKHP
jgi:hypothetical protein